MTHTKHIVGIDEAGRGPVAGPVAVAAVKVAADRMAELAERYATVRDSKQLSPQKRRGWYADMCLLRDEGLLDFRVSLIGPQTIDRHGIRTAITRGTRSTLTRLSSTAYDSLRLDGGLTAPRTYRDQRTIVKGDETEWIIALASIVAKVTRDAHMERLALRHPLYAFEEHKGYATAAHIKHIKRHGPSDAHRRSFLTRFI